MKRRYASTLLLMSVAAGGCAPHVEHDNRPAVAPVTGTVLFQGKPVGDAHVTFVPQNGSAAAFGKTDEEGRFRLTTFASGDGAVIGPHAVKITKQEIIGAPPSDNPADYQRYENQPPARTRSLLPRNYGDTKRSGLKADVTDSESNNFTFELHTRGQGAVGKNTASIARSRPSKN